MGKFRYLSRHITLKRNFYLCQGFLSSLLILQVLLFEKATFLVIAQAQIVEHKDIHRFEKVSNIIKQFKLSCRSSLYIFLVIF